MLKLIHPYSHDGELPESSSAVSSDAFWTFAGQQNSFPKTFLAVISLSPVPHDLFHTYAIGKTVLLKRGRRGTDSAFNSFPSSVG